MLAAMTMKPRYRLATDEVLAKGVRVTLSGNASHYLTHVLRLKAGDTLGLFNRTQGEWFGRLETIAKRSVTLAIELQLREASAPVGLTVCFAPIKGGRLETIIEKATELGADVLQPVITHRTIVDKVNVERAEAIAREAAEQCERANWPEIRSPMKLLPLLGAWPQDVPLIYGDESGASPSILEGGLTPFANQSSLTPAANGSPWKATQGDLNAAGAGSTGGLRETMQKRWGILVGPEGGFTPEEFAALKHVKAARGVSLGPRILRADTAVITLASLTLAAWGDWDQRPRFTNE